LKLRPHRVTNRCLLNRRNCCILVAELLAGEIIFDQACQANEGPSRIVLSEVRAHAIEAAVVHQVGLLEPGLASDDVLIRGEDRARIGHENRRLWRSTIICEDSRPGEQHKTYDGNSKQNPLQHVANSIGGGDRGGIR
jgi:hypothetical protein